MTSEEETIFTIRGVIATLPADQQKACLELAEHIRRYVKSAGEPVGPLALALVGAEGAAGQL